MYVNMLPNIVCRVMYWSDWGRNPRLEIASMDGSERRDFVITDISQPNGISIDLVSQRVYWSDSDLDKLEFIGFDGSGRTAVETGATGLQQPFAVSVGGDVLFWSDWDTNSVYATHKEHGANYINGHFATIASFPSTPYGVEALHFDRQPSGESNNCHVVAALCLGVVTQWFLHWHSSRKSRVQCRIKSIIFFSYVTLLACVSANI